MADRSVSVTLRANIDPYKTAMAQAVDVTKKFRNSLGDQFSARDAGSLAGSFARTFSGRLEAAFRSLPKAMIFADTSDAEIRIQTVRSALVDLSNKTIGVDIDANTAMAELRAISDELGDIRTSADDVNLRIDAATAFQQLQALHEEVDRLDGRNVRLDVDTSSALASLGKLTDDAGELGGKLSGALGVLGSVGPAQVGIAAAAIHALPTVAGVAAAGIVTALGAGLAAVGIKAAAQADAVQARWGRLGVELQRELADTAQPLEGSLIRAADVAERTFERLKPSLANIFRDLVPDVDYFVEKAGQALSNLGPSLERLGGSFGGMLRQLGDSLPAIMENLSNTFDTFSGMMNDDPRMLADLVEDATQLLSEGAKVISWVGDLSAVLSLAFANTKPLTEKLGLNTFERDMLAVPNSIKAAEAAVLGTQAAFERLGSSAGTAAGSVNSLRSSIGDLVGVATNAMTAEIEFQRSIDNATAAAKKNGEAISTNTEKGRANREALIGMAERANDYRQALIEQGTPLEEVTNKLGTQRAAFLRVADSMGFSKKEAKTLADQLGLIPGNVKTDVKTPGGKEALSLIKEYEAKLRALDGKTVTTAVNQVIRYSRQQVIDKNREAGAIDYYASGGIRPGPHIATRPTVLYGEGRGPEAFIPYEGRYRDRAISLLSQVADDFGLQVFNKEAEAQARDLQGGLKEANYGISAGLSSATSMLEQTLGSAGSLTGSIVNVGAVGQDLVAGWVEGSTVLGDSVTDMGTTVSTSLGELGKTVQDLSAVIGEAASWTASQTSSTSSAKRKGKAPPVQTGDAMGPTDAEIRARMKKNPPVQTGDKYGPSDAEIRRRLAAKAAMKVPGGSLREAAFASGGFIAGPTRALLGEDGPEVVIPLGSRYRGEALGLLSRAQSMLGVGSAVPGGQLRDAYAGGMPGVSAPVNSSKVSRPQQMSSAQMALAAAMSNNTAAGTGQSGGADGRRGGLVQIQGDLVVRERADADLVAAQLYSRLGSKGP
jgi:hypothetical protein